MADTVVNFLARLLRPLLVYPARWLAGPKKGSTWHYEAVFVALVLVIVAYCTTPVLQDALADTQVLTQFLIVWISAVAVLGSFLHAQVGTYMAEDMGSTEEPLTECYHKLGTYWVYKEIAWFLVFLLSGAYPAIAGNVIFLIFPAWRRIYKQERERLTASST